MQSTMKYSREDDLLIQSYFTTSFLVELSNNNFLQSDFYKSMKFEDKYVHQNLPSIGIGNRGCMLMCFYSLLVIPKQFLDQPEHLSEFKNLNNKIETFVVEKDS